MVALEEKELACWRAQISERCAALRDLLGPIIIIQLHDVGQQQGGVRSQAQYLGSRVDSIEAQVQKGNEVGTFGVLMNAFLSAEVSRMGSEIRRVGTDVQMVQQAIHKISPHISDPFFYVRNPLGERIPILLSHYHIFDHIATALMREAHMSSVVITALYPPTGVIIPRLRLRGELRAGIEFDMSIIKRKPLREAAQKCPHCSTPTEMPSKVVGSIVQTSHVGRDIKCPGLKKFLLRKYRR
ncbi:hypothetical protein B0H14DRAFT_3161419, partial [Mycena olivaceomarginata]